MARRARGKKKHPGPGSTSRGAERSAIPAAWSSGDKKGSVGFAHHRRNDQRDGETARLPEDRLLRTILWVGRRGLHFFGGVGYTYDCTPWSRCFVKLNSEGSRENLHCCMRQACGILIQKATSQVNSNHWLWNGARLHREYFGRRNHTQTLFLEAWMLDIADIQFVSASWVHAAGPSAHSSTDDGFSASVKSCWCGECHRHPKTFASRGFFQFSYQGGSTVRQGPWEMGLRSLVTASVLMSLWVLDWNLPVASSNTCDQKTLKIFEVFFFFFCGASLFKKTVPWNLKLNLNWPPRGA